MNSKEIRKRFLDFFEKNGHTIVPSSSLIPQDPTVLFTTAGMQQLTLYLQGERDPLVDFGSRHLASAQKSFRTGDIDEVGDDTHHTFFEMLGNWSIGKDEKGHYFKEGAIKYALDFLVNDLGLDKKRIFATIFKGERGIPRDADSFRIWQENKIGKERISQFGLSDNFWGPVGKTGPCGPCSEIFYDKGKDFGCGNSDCGPNCPHCNRFVELWNLVFMEYVKNEQGEYQLMSQTNVDTGIGFERLVAVLQGKDSGYETDLLEPIVQEIEKISGKRYQQNKRIFRIIADHIRGIVFVASEGVFPSNVERGYILRRLLRRVIRFGKTLNAPANFLIPLAQKVVEVYRDVYPEVKSKETDILTIIQKEEEKFSKELEKGINESIKRIKKIPQLTGDIAFNIYETYSVDVDSTIQIAREHNVKISKELKKEFEEARTKHQEISRTGAEKKFGGIGEGATLEATKLHTATHLLHQALREILGEHVKQMGSDITAKRLRFDFSHFQKMTPGEIKKVENLVNQKIREDLRIEKKEMSYQEAVDWGALAFFKEKYPEKVTVYSVNNFSKEICGGPHVKRTGGLGHFKITKEESSGAGVRRIRAILE